MRVARKQTRRHGYLLQGIRAALTNPSAEAMGAHQIPFCQRCCSPSSEALPPAFLSSLQVATSLHVKASQHQKVHELHAVTFHFVESHQHFPVTCCSAQIFTWGRAAVKVPYLYLRQGSNERGPHREEWRGVRGRGRRGGLQPQGGEEEGQVRGGEEEERGGSFALWALPRQEERNGAAQMDGMHSLLFINYAFQI